MKRVTLFILISFSLHAGEIINLSVIEKNQIINNSQINLSTVRQGEINILGDSTVNNVNVGDTQSINTIDASSIENASLQQGGVDLNDSSLISTTILVQNKLIDSQIQNDSHVQQGTIKITNGTMKESQLNLTSSIDHATVDNSTLSQNEVLITNSTVNGLTLTGVHTIANENDAISITNSDVTQGRISVLEGSTLSNTIIDRESSINDTTITNASVDLCSLYMTNGSTLSGSEFHGDCLLEDTSITGANFTQGKIVVY